MGKLHPKADRRRRVGRVSIYPHRRRWWVYYREHGRPVRKAVADNREAAEQVAAQINLELTASTPTLFSFRPVSVTGLQQSFIEYHEHVVRSSLATVNRYRTATQHLVNFSTGRHVEARRSKPAAGDTSLVSASQFYGIDINGFVVELAKVTQGVVHRTAARHIYPQRGQHSGRIVANHLAVQLLHAVSLVAICAHRTRLH